MSVEISITDQIVEINETSTPVEISVAAGASVSPVWGAITGTLSNQTDLQNALNAKFDDPTGTTSQYLRGDGTLATFPTITSGTVTSVGLTMPTAFTVANSPVTSSGTLAVTGAGTTAQYIRGDGSLDTFPTLTGFVPYTGATANVDLGTYTILAQNATISSSGSGDTATITHSSGSGIALNITKGGNNEGLYVNKTGGSGNAATIIGTLNATTLVKSGGTSTQYLMADGTTSTLTNPITGTGTAGQVSYWSGTSTQAGSNNLFWDNANGRLGIGTATPAASLTINSAATLATGIRFDNAGSVGSIFGDGVSMTIRSGATHGIQINTGSASLVQSNASTGGFRIDLQTLTNVPIYSYLADGDTGIGRAAADTLTFYAGGEKARIFSTGNLLLQNGGTFTDSGEKLQVNGTAKITGASTFGGNMGLTLNQNGVTSFVATNLGTGSSTVSVVSVNTNSGNGEIGKRNSTVTTYKTLLGGDTYIYNSTTAGDISILNDFASGSIKMAAGGSATAQWTIGSNGDLTAADGENIIFGTTTGTKIGTATSQKLSLWNATPIVQPTTGIAEAAFVENLGGSIVNVDSTFDGYTMQQVVKALRNMGALA
jgi:hypothetical protein